MALVLDGVDQRAIYTPTLSISSNQDHTFFIWASSTTLAEEYIFNLVGDGSGFKVVGLHKDSSNHPAGRYIPNSISVLATAVDTLAPTLLPVMVKWVESTGTISVQVEENAVVTATGSPNDLSLKALSIGARFSSSGLSNPTSFFTGAVAHAAYWEGTALTGADVTGLMDGTLKPDEASVAPTHYKPFVNDQTGGIGSDYTLFNSPTIDSEDPYASAAPTITGPDSTTEGSVTVQTGTLQNTITTQSLVYASNEIVQSIDSATATTLNYIARSGVSLATPVTAVSGIPFAATVTAAGITPYVVQQKAGDGTNPPATRNITLNVEATHEVIQTMAGVANTNPDESIFGTTYVVVEDNHQARVPKVVDGVTFTWNDKGEFTTDKDQTVVFQYELFSPSTGNWSAITLTVRDTSIIAVGMVTAMVSDMVSNMIEDM